MPRAPLPDLSIALTFLRSGQGWSQADLGEVSGISPNLLNDYERGRKNLTRARLIHVIAFMGLPSEAADTTLAALAANRALGRAPEDPPGSRSRASRRIEATASRIGNAMADFARTTLSQLTLEGESLQARQRAGLLWERLKRHPPAERRVIVKRGVQYRTWALCEKVAAESIRLAPNHPKEALELAEVALLIAERVPEEQTWNLRLQGYAWAHVSNARRVCNDLPGAETAIVRARKLWEAGEPGDPGFLKEAWLPWIESALRKDQRRFRDALRRIDEALALDSGELRAEILLSKARVHETLGSPEASTAALLEAAPFIDPRREPRLAFGIRFNLLVDLCQLGKFNEAAPRLPEVRALAERLGEELDLTRVLWLEAKVAAGIGRTIESQAAFEQVRKVFGRRELTFDYALVSLELAVLLLEQNCTASVRMLAEEMLRIFRKQEIEREALAALRLFCDAAQQETATVDLARRLVRFLTRAQHDPKLCFASPQDGAEAYTASAPGSSSG
jgi:transcriptional regulator with XRE-family HTH domain